MTKWIQEWNLICHWCGNAYRSKKNRLRSRFCSNAHKQAHYRAYKNYVTHKRQAGDTIRPGPGRSK